LCRLSCTSIPLLFGTVPTTSEVVYHIEGRALLLRVDRTLSRVTMIPSSHRRDSAALLGTDDNRWATNATNFPDTIITTIGSLVNESINNVSVFSGQPSYLVPALHARTSLQCGIQNNRHSNADHFHISVQRYNRIPTIKSLRFCTPGRIRTCGQRARSLFLAPYPNFKHAILDLASPDMLRFVCSISFANRASLLPPFLLPESIETGSMKL